MKLKTLHELNNEFKTEKLTNYQSATLELPEPPIKPAEPAIEMKCPIISPEDVLKSLHELNNEFQKRQRVKS